MLGICFPGDELGFKWTVLVGTQKGSGTAMATAVPVKGGGSSSYRISVLSSLGKMVIRKGR